MPHWPRPQSPSLDDGRTVRARVLGPVWVTFGVAAALVAAVVGAGVLVQLVALPTPPRAALVALRAATHLERHRLVDSTFTLGDSTVHGRCVQDWFSIDGHRRRGAALRLDDGFVLLAVPPHTLVSSGGTAAQRAASPLVLMELGGCPRVLARRLETLAQQRRGLMLRGGRLLFSLKGTRVALTLAPSTGIPLRVSVASPAVRGSGRIRFIRMTPALRRRLSGGFSSVSGRKPPLR
jgi:hypothetical protein